MPSGADPQASPFLRIYHLSNMLWIIPGSPGMPPQEGIKSSVLVQLNTPSPHIPLHTRPAANCPQTPGYQQECVVFSVHPTFDTTWLLPALATSFSADWACGLRPSTSIITLTDCSSKGTIVRVKKQKWGKIYNLHLKWSNQRSTDHVVRMASVVRDELYQHHNVLTNTDYCYILTYNSKTYVAVIYVRCWSAHLGPRPRCCGTT